MTVPPYKLSLQDLSDRKPLEETVSRHYPEGVAGAGAATLAARIDLFAHDLIAHPDFFSSDGVSREREIEGLCHLINEKSLPDEQKQSILSIAFRALAPDLSVTELEERLSIASKPASLEEKTLLLKTLAWLSSHRTLSKDEIDAIVHLIKGVVRSNSVSKPGDKAESLLLMLKSSLQNADGSCDIEGVLRELIRLRPMFAHPKMTGLYLQSKLLLLKHASDADIARFSGFCFGSQYSAQQIKNNCLLIFFTLKSSIGSDGLNFFLLNSAAQGDEVLHRFPDEHKALVAESMIKRSTAFYGKSPWQIITMLFQENPSFRTICVEFLAKDLINEVNSLKQFDIELLVNVDLGFELSDPRREKALEIYIFDFLYRLRPDLSMDSPLFTSCAVALKHAFSSGIKSEFMAYIENKIRSIPLRDQERVNLITLCLCRLADTLTPDEAEKMVFDPLFYSPKEKLKLFTESLETIPPATKKYLTTILPSTFLERATSAHRELLIRSVTALSTLATDSNSVTAKAIPLEKLSFNMLENLLTQMQTLAEGGAQAFKFEVAVAAIEFMAKCKRQIDLIEFIELVRFLRTTRTDLKFEEIGKLSVAIAKCISIGSYFQFAGTRLEALRHKTMQKVAVMEKLTFIPETSRQQLCVELFKIIDETDASLSFGNLFAIALGRNPELARDIITNMMESEELSSTTIAKALKQVLQGKDPSSIPLESLGRVIEKFFKMPDHFLANMMTQGSLNNLSIEKVDELLEYISRPSKDLTTSNSQSTQNGIKILSHFLQGGGLSIEQMDLIVEKGSRIESSNFYYISKMLKKIPFEMPLGARLTIFSHLCKTINPLNSADLARLADFAIEFYQTHPTEQAIDKLLSSFEMVRLGQLHTSSTQKELFFHHLLVLGDRITPQSIFALMSLPEEGRTPEAICERASCITFSPEQCQQNILNIVFFPSEHRNLALDELLRLHTAGRLSSFEFIHEAGDFVSTILESRPELINTTCQYLLGVFESPEYNLINKLYKTLLSKTSLAEGAPYVYERLGLTIDSPVVFQARIAQGLIESINRELANPYALFSKMKSFLSRPPALTPYFTGVEGPSFSARLAGGAVESKEDSPAVAEKLTTKYLVRPSLEGLKKQSEKFAETKKYSDLPASVSERTLILLFSEFSARLNALPDAERKAIYISMYANSGSTVEGDEPEEVKGRNIYLALARNLLDDRYITGLMRQDGEPDAIVPVDKYQFFILLDALLSASNEVCEGEKLSPREDLLLKLSNSIRFCPAGKSEGIRLYYNLISSELAEKRAVSVAEKISLDAYRFLSSEMTKLMTEATPFMYKATGISPAAPIPQQSHQTIFLSNILARRLHLQWDLKFDKHTHTLCRPLVSYSFSQLDHIFLEHFQKSSIMPQLVDRTLHSLNQILKDIDLDLKTEKTPEEEERLTKAKSLQYWLAEFMSFEPPFATYEEDAETSTITNIRLTTTGAIEVLQHMGLIEKASEISLLKELLKRIHEGASHAAMKEQIESSYPHLLPILYYYLDKIHTAKGSKLNEDPEYGKKAFSWTETKYHSNLTDQQEAVERALADVLLSSMIFSLSDTKLDTLALYGELSEINPALGSTISRRLNSLLIKKGKIEASSPRSIADLLKNKDAYLEEINEVLNTTLERFRAC